MTSRGLAGGLRRDHLVTPGAASQNGEVCRGGTPYQPATVEDDDPAQRARNNAFHPRGDEVKKMAPRDRTDFTEDEWSRLCADRRQQLRERLAEQQAMPTSGSSDQQTSGASGQHRRCKGEEKHEGAPPVVNGKILGGKAGKGQTLRSGASRAAALFKKAVQRCTGARPLKPSPSSSSSSSEGGKAKMKTYEVRREIVESSHTVLVDTAIKFPTGPPPPVKQHRRKRSIIKAVFLPSAREKNAPPSKRITTDMIQILGCERLGAPQVPLPVHSEVGAGSSHQMGTSTPCMGRPVSEPRKISEEVAISKNGGPYRPRLLYPLLVVMKSYIRDNTILYNFFISNSLYLLPMPRPAAFRRKSTMTLPSPSKSSNKPANVLVWYPKESRTRLPRDAPRSCMEDFGGPSFSQRNKTQERPEAPATKVSKRKRWFSFKASKAVKKILYKPHRRSDSAVRAAAKAEHLHDQYIRETVDVVPPISFEEWKRLKAAMDDATKKRILTEATDQQPLFGIRMDEGYQSEFVRLPLSDKAYEEIYGEPPERNRFQRAIAKVFPQRSAEEQPYRRRPRQRAFEHETQYSEFEMQKAPEQEEFEHMTAIGAEEWEDVNPTRDSISGPERIFPDTITASAENSTIDNVADYHGLENLPPLYRTIYVKLFEAGKDIRIMRSVLHGSRQAHCNASAESTSAIVSTDPTMTQLYTLYGISETAEDSTSRVQQWFCPTAEEVEYAINAPAMSQRASSNFSTHSHPTNDILLANTHIHLNNPVEHKIKNIEVNSTCDNHLTTATMDRRQNTKFPMTSGYGLETAAAAQSPSN
ncbi:hypothetical protein ABW21_db0205240 [Orbilia brochopaga]|nr:hypothetical protein ABW21_db0205240 [Drechslerella brochopaga]